MGTAGIRRGQLDAYGKRAARAGLCWPLARACQVNGSGTEEVVPVGQLSKIRCLSGVEPARPYICRFKSLNFVLVPSIGPLL